VLSRLGHFVRQSATTIEYSRVDIRDQRAISDESPDEVYANEFGSCLLMPKVAVETFFEIGMDDVEMALRFVVSREAMQNRLTGLGMKAARLGAAR
jgi:Zn-dependent peptidase ImmA (M78 family)